MHEYTLIEFCELANYLSNKIKQSTKEGALFRTGNRRSPRSTKDWANTNYQEHQERENMETSSSATN
jgi:hypothetical protein